MRPQGAEQVVDHRGAVFAAWMAYSQSFLIKVLLELEHELERAGLDSPAPRGVVRAERAGAARLWLRALAAGSVLEAGEGYVARPPCWRRTRIRVIAGGSTKPGAALRPESLRVPLITSALPASRKSRYALHSAGRFVNASSRSDGGTLPCELSDHFDRVISACGAEVGVLKVRG